MDSDDVSPDCIERLKEWKCVILSKSNRLYVSQVPSINGVAIGRLSSIYEMIDSYKMRVPGPIYHQLQTYACHKSIKFGDLLTVSQASNLIKRLSMCKQPNSCAHGRPVAIPIYSL